MISYDQLCHHWSLKAHVLVRVTKGHQAATSPSPRKQSMGRDLTRKHRRVPSLLFPPPKNAPVSRTPRDNLTRATRARRGCCKARLLTSASELPKPDAAWWPDLARGGCRVVWCGVVWGGVALLRLSLMWLGWWRESLREIPRNAK